MNDQAIVMLLSFVGLCIGIITPIIKLNTTMTKMNVTLDKLQKQTEQNYVEISKRVTEHGKEIDDLKQKVAVGLSVIERLDK